MAFRATTFLEFTKALKDSATPQFADFENLEFAVCDEERPGILSALFSHLCDLCYIQPSVLEHIMGLFVEPFYPTEEDENALLELLYDFPYKAKGHNLEILVNEEKLDDFKDSGGERVTLLEDTNFFSFDLTFAELQRRSNALLLWIALCRKYGDIDETRADRDPVPHQVDDSLTVGPAHIPWHLQSSWVYHVPNHERLFPSIPSSLLNWIRDEGHMSIQYTCQPDVAALEDLFYMYKMLRVPSDCILLLANAMTTWQSRRLCQLLKKVAGSRPVMRMEFLAAAHMVMLTWPTDAPELILTPRYYTVRRLDNFLELAPYGGSSEGGEICAENDDRCAYFYAGNVEIEEAAETHSITTDEVDQSPWDYDPTLRVNGFYPDEFAAGWNVPPDGTPRFKAFCSQDSVVRGRRRLIGSINANRRSSGFARWPQPRRSVARGYGGRSAPRSSYDRTHTDRVGKPSATGFKISHFYPSSHLSTSANTPNLSARAPASKWVKPQHLKADHREFENFANKTLQRYWQHKPSANIMRKALLQCARTEGWLPEEFLEQTLSEYEFQLALLDAGVPASEAKSLWGLLTQGHEHLYA
eukprot:Blabericola_migrator_1__5248@NODE_269_length_10566_cov_217_328317_g225_i0_p3_GENE_NODE_269_length_10566_cov_217_328317_g225_i0NODE_269_length_10566_cov_217_328317_g225_i0_p3_ORF_typecomplete_len585_score54_39_NODE_269_length_10566_cov_217_328317_g225_i04722226